VIKVGDVLTVLATPEALHSLEFRLFNPEKTDQGIAPIAQITGAKGAE
jgi:hypothetical protein